MTDLEQAEMMLAMCRVSHNAMRRNLDEANDRARRMHRRAQAMESLLHRSYQRIYELENQILWGHERRIYEIIDLGDKWRARKLWLWWKKQWWWHDAKAWMPWA